LVTLSSCTFPNTDTSRSSSTDNVNNNDNNDNNKRNIVLLQVPHNLLSSITNGSSYMVGSTGNDRIYIDDEDFEKQKNVVNLILPNIGKSYALSRVETSNTLIAIPPPSASTSTSTTAEEEGDTIRMKGEVLGRPTCSFLELRPFAINRQHVFDLLCKQDSLTTLSSLAHDLQCSEIEIKHVLHKIPRAYCCDTAAACQKWSIMEEEVDIEINSYIIECIIEHDWQDQLDDNGAAKAITLLRAVELVTGKLQLQKNILPLDCLKTSIIRHCILSMTTADTDDGDTDGNGSTIITFDTRKILITVSKAILLKHHSKFNNALSIQSFLKVLERELPYGIQIPKEQDKHYTNLHTVLHAIVGIVNEKTIDYYPQDLLSLDPKKRFRQLFTKSTTWNHTDLVPYLYALGDEDEDSIKVLLSDYTRIDNGADEVLIYTSK